MKNELSGIKSIEDAVATILETEKDEQLNIWSRVFEALERGDGVPFWVAITHLFRLSKQLDGYLNSLSKSKKELKKEEDGDYLYFYASQAQACLLMTNHFRAIVKVTPSERHFSKFNESQRKECADIKKELERRLKHYDSVMKEFLNELALIGKKYG